jgi:hypothetical protein
MAFVKELAGYWSLFGPVSVAHMRCFETQRFQTHSGFTNASGASPRRKSGGAGLLLVTAAVAGQQVGKAGGLVANAVGELDGLVAVLNFGQ